MFKEVFSDLDQAFKESKATLEQIGKNMVDDAEGGWLVFEKLVVHSHQIKYIKPANYEDTASIGMITMHDGQTVSTGEPFEQVIQVFQ
jgi:hypothetical protein